MIVAMCLYPPMYVHYENAVARATDAVITFQGLPDTPYEGEEVIRYRFAFAPSSWESGLSGNDEYSNARIAIGRLLIQLLIVVVVFGITAYIIPSQER